MKRLLWRITRRPIVTETTHVERALWLAIGTDHRGNALGTRGWGSTKRQAEASFRRQVRRS